MKKTELGRLSAMISRRGPCRRLGLNFLRAYTELEKPGMPHGQILWTWKMAMLAIGGDLEDTIEVVELAVKQGRDAKDELRALANETKSISDVILPSLLDQIKAMRDARFALTSEAGQCMASLKEVRKFFFDSDYHTEMARLKEFIALMQQLKQLQEDGTLDAVSEVMIKLAVGGEHAGKQGA